MRTHRRENLIGPDRRLSYALKRELRWDGSIERMWAGLSDRLAESRETGLSESRVSGMWENLSRRLHPESGDRGEGSGNGANPGLTSRVTEGLLMMKSLRMIEGFRMAVAIAVVSVCFMIIMHMAVPQYARVSTYGYANAPSINVAARTDEVAPGELFFLNLKVSAARGDLEVGLRSPVLRVCQLSSPGQCRIVSEYPVMNSFVGTSVPAGTVLSEEQVVVAPKAPGWYCVDVMIPVPESNKHYVAGGSQMFLVRYPEGETLEGQLAVEEKVTSDGCTLTIHNISMNHRQTEVTYSLSDTRSIQPHDVSLLAADSKHLVLLKREEQVGVDRVFGTAVFGPTPSEAQTLAFQVNAVGGNSGNAPGSRILVLRVALSNAAAETEAERRENNT